MSRDPSTVANGTPRSGVHRPWRLVLGDGSDLTPLDGATNMAIDAALLESVKGGAAPVLRLYWWSPACLSFGRNQPTRDRYDRAAAATRGIDFVRRPTGGQAVLHDDELTYAVIAPVDVIGRPRAAYAAINGALVGGLRRLGVEAALAGAGSRARVGAPAAGSAPGSTAGSVEARWDAACFRRPERGEVVAGGAKLVGSAQRMEARTILQHGSILTGGSQAAAEELLLRPVGSLPDASSDAAGWTTLGAELGRRPTVAELGAAIRAGFGTVLGAEPAEAALTDVEWKTVGRERGRFESEEWTWRR